MCPRWSAERAPRPLRPGLLTDRPGMSVGTVVIDRPGGGVGVLTLNRPHVLNAIDSALLHELRAALTDFDRDDAIRAIVLTGAGDRAFSAGADIHESAAWSAA